MRKEIIATTSIMKAPPSDTTNGTKTLLPFLLLHEPEVAKIWISTKTCTYSNI